LLILTHPDDADLAALPAVLARYSVGQVITGGQPSESDTYQALLAALAPYPQLAVRAGYNLALSDGVQMTVWNPAAPPALGDPTGDHALVLRVQYGEVAFLLTGDVNAAAQARLLADGLPPATVLQLPQHGAARSLADGLLAAVRPAALVLQSDPANRRGDPDEGTLQQLPPGVPLWRTDTGGTLHFWTDGRSLWVQPEVAP
jgi:competence protein ComEC